jgi:membrane dipeptidase
MDRAKELHERALVADLHCDTVMQMSRGYDISQRNANWHIDIPRLIEGGVNLQVFACFVGFLSPEEECPAEVTVLLDTLHRDISARSDQIAICLTADEAREIIKSNRIAAFIGIENGMALNNDIARLDEYYGRGVRYMTLIHNKSNGWCISANDTDPEFNGLSEFGCQVVERMNEIGMIVDVSHVHPLGVSKVLEVTNKPIISSHSCAHAICPHPRNLTDDQIRAIANTGGMIGMNYHGDFVSEKRWQVTQQFREDYPGLDMQFSLYVFGELTEEEIDKDRERLETAHADLIARLQPVNPDVANVVNHIEHIANVGGFDVIGLGSDFDGIFVPPNGLEDTSCVPAITAELVKRGNSSENIEKILGENFMRVFADICG